MEPLTLSGRVVERPYGRGSKSERLAVLLETADQTLVLRRQGGNPFQDETLQRLVGREIDAEGFLHGSTFIMRAWCDAGSTAGAGNDDDVREDGPSNTPES